MREDQDSQLDRPSASPANEEGSAAGSAPVVSAADASALDDIEGIDFLLEEIENKIAPLALA